MERIWTSIGLPRVSDWLRPYTHLPGYLHRWQVFSFGRCKVRIHQILCADRTPLLHTHPFNYASLILSGGYIDQTVVDGQIVEHIHTAGDIVVRRGTTAHRIKAVLPNTSTLFCTWVTADDSQGWTVLRHPQVIAPEEYFDAPCGIYHHKTGFRKRQDGVWFALRNSIDDAIMCTRLSIHQDIPHTELRYALDPTEQSV